MEPGFVVDLKDEVVSQDLLEAEILDLFQVCEDVNPVSAPPMVLEERRNCLWVNGVRKLEHRSHFSLIPSLRTPPFFSIFHYISPLRTA